MAFGHASSRALAHLDDGGSHAKLSGEAEKPSAGHQEPNGELEVGLVMKATFPTMVLLLVGFLSGVTGCSKKETPASVVASDPKPDLPKPTPNVDPTDRAKSDVDFPVDQKGTTSVDNDDYSRGINKHANAIHRRPWDEQAIVDFASWLEGNDKPRA